MKLFFSALFSLLIISATAQRVNVTSTSDFIRECTKSVGELPNKQMALFLPVDFWRIIGDQMNLSTERLNIISQEIKNYMMICVVDYTLSTEAGISFKSEEDIRKSIRIVDSAKNEYRPLSTSEVSPIASGVLDNFKPVLAQMLGQFGKGMHVFLFKQKMNGEKPAIDITKQNKFSLAWDATTITWQLPFVSTMPVKFCPVDHEQMKGNWNYCPIHGNKLD